MGRIFVQLMLVVVAVGLFFGYTDSIYRGEGADTINKKQSIKQLNEQIDEYDKALGVFSDIAKKEDVVSNQYLKIKADEQHLRDLLPVSIDNIRLINNVNIIAVNHNLVIKNFSFEGATSNSSKDTSANSKDTKTPTDLTKGGNEKVGAVNLKFSVTTTYPKIKEFLMALEDSLRIMDVVAFNVKPAQSSGGPGSSSSSASSADIYQYDITVRTYWLR